MRNIETELAKLFKYERNLCPLLLKLIQENNKDTKVNHFNIKVNNGVYEGSIPFIGSVNDKIGTQLVYYIADKVIEDNSEVLLPTPLNIYSDCNKTYYGLLTNCLAYLSGQKVNKISLVQMWNNQIINIKVKPLIAEHILLNLYQFIQENKKEKKEELLYNPNQSYIQFTY